MKTIMIKEPYKIEVVETEMPVRQKGEALLRVLYCGICGADVQSYTGNQPFTTYPRIPGHEFSAQIVELDENDFGLSAGDIVTANPYFNCNNCYSCKRGFVNCCTSNQTMGVQRHGSFAEYITMPLDRIYKGEGLSAKELALIEPFAISYHATQRANIKKGDKVLIMGAGPIGIFALICAKMKTHDVTVADVLDGKLKLAEKFGAKTINITTTNLVDETQKITMGNGFDVCIEACGQSEAFLNCIESAAFAGNIILIGNGKKETTFLHSIILKKELNIFGSRNAKAQDFIDLIYLAKIFDISQVISKVYELNHAQTAFDHMVSNDGSLTKVLVRFGEET